MKTKDKTRDELIELVQEQRLLIDVQQDQINQLKDKLFDERLFRVWVYPIISVALIAVTVFTVKHFNL